MMVPVFTCFKYDHLNSLETRYIERYAQWAKNENIRGVLVNSVIGEAPALSISERKANAEAWNTAAVKNDLTIMLQIGGAAIPDVLDMAQHGEKLGVNAILCLPELFYKPRNIDELVSYCRTVAKECSTIPFFYYHIPQHTHVDFPMNEFCARAEERIPNFYGLMYCSTDLDMASRLLHEGRTVILGIDSMLASGLLLGFESASMSFFNVRPDLAREIFDAMKNNNLKLAREKQTTLNVLMMKRTIYRESYDWLAAIKFWFNEEMEQEKGIGFTAGPVRKYW